MKCDLTTDRPPLVDAYEQLVAASEEDGGFNVQRGLEDLRRRAVQAEPANHAANVRASTPQPVTPAGIRNIYRKAGKTTHLSAVSIESDQIGTPKEELNVALTQFRVSCGDPAQPESLSIRTVARNSRDLATHYQPPYDPPSRLYPLSATAISEILSGKRRALPAFDWVASYVLSCQRHAVGYRHGRRDQGTAILRPWANIYAAHAPDAANDPTAAFRLPQHQKDFLLTHGPYGKTLLARAQRGHPHARYRVALLLACDPTQTEDAVGLLIDVASTGHPLALDLLDNGREAIHSPGLAGGLSPQTVAQRAWYLARTAWAYGADNQAYAFCRAAARGGIPDAVLALAWMRLTDIDPEAAQWLGQFGAESAVGHHRSLNCG